MRARPLVLICLVLAIVASGCASFDPSGISLGGADAARPADARVDAAPGQPDAAPGDAALPPAPAHLLITEVGVEPDVNEFVEIYNPGSTTVSLSNYYLADNSEYAKLPGIFGSGPLPSPIGTAADFIVKFPDNASIGPGEVKVIAVYYGAFTGEYAAPDFAVVDAPYASTRMVAPDGSLIGDTPHVTNLGELIVLFYWDGTSDLVRDVDMINTGIPDAGNQYTSKSGLAVDGPDGNTNATTYAGDADTLPTAMSYKAGAYNSHKRVALEDGYEQRDVGGNGLFGDDETSEDTAMTWDAAGPFSPSTPGTVPASLSGQ